MNRLGKKIYIFCSATVFLAMAVILGLNIIQSPEKTESIYKSAIEEYNKENYAKAYYLFSKVIITSNLKPLAIYHQAVAADKIEDYKSGIKQYRFFLLLHPKHFLAPKVKYNMAQDLINNKTPEKAKKHFDEIINKYPHTDYAIASEYFKALIEQQKYEKDTIFPLSVKNEIQSGYRHYLKKAPSGKFAFNAVSNWEKLDADISKDDYSLMAKTAYLFGDYEKAKVLIEKADLKSSWTIAALNHKALGDTNKSIALIEWGLKGNADYVDKKDLQKAIDSYFDNAASKYAAASHLQTITSAAGKEYINAIKCRYAPKNDIFNCYKDLYLAFPQGEYADEAQARMFLHMVNKNDIENAQRIGIDFINKYKESSDYAPMVMYYLGRVSERARSYKDYMSYYKSVITKYPDTYYAYRAFLKLNRIHSSTIANYIHPAPVEYPYTKSHAFLDTLISLGDFEVLEEYSKYDDFLRSWILYRKGEFSKSMLLARDAMDKLRIKPDKSDLRWRLVYPIIYYDDIKKYADKYGNNAPLILAIVREESYFNPNAESSAGAKGLMQLMPSTATDISSYAGLTVYNLFVPAQNLVLGNAYYSSLRHQLGDLDISAVAAYNGGAGSVNVWKQSINYSDTDTFIEQIPYPETQNYVKKVFRTYWNYLRIYDGYN